VLVPVLREYERQDWGNREFGHSLVFGEVQKKGMFLTATRREPAQTGCLRSDPACMENVNVNLDRSVTAPVKEGGMLSSAEGRVRTVGPWGGPDGC